MITITYEKFKDFQNQWVAVDEKTGDIVVSGKSMIDVNAELDRRDIRSPNIVLHFVHSFTSRLAPSVL